MTEHDVRQMLKASAEQHLNDPEFEQMLQRVLDRIGRDADPRFAAALAIHCACTVIVSGDTNEHRLVMAKAMGSLLIDFAEGAAEAMRAELMSRGVPS